MKRRSFQAPTEDALKALVARELGEEAVPLIERGAVYVDGRRTRLPDAPVRQGQTILAVLEEGGVSALAAARELPPLRVLFEDDAVIAVDKPAGVTAQATAAREGESLLDMVQKHLGREAGLVHRLDKETSGVTVFGKTAAATTALAEAFREGKAEKRYFAITGPGLPAEGVIDLPLSKDPSRPGRWRATKRANGIPAVTEFKTVHAGRFCIVSLHPKTGRTHQLRAHLTALGCPILGDKRYGGASELGNWSAPRCLLHAERLTLPHPTTGKPLLLISPVPEDLAVFFRAANLDLPS